AEVPIDTHIRRKIAQFCNVENEDVIASLDAESIYEVPLLMLEEGLDKRVIQKLELKTSQPDLTNWIRFVDAVKHASREIRIGIVGKYVEHQDAYKSIAESFIHAGAVNDCKVELDWIQSDDITPGNVADRLEGLSGILVAPGFGDRGIDGKLTAVHYVRTQNIPFFGICLGMQCAVIEFARNICGWEEANSTEFDKNTEKPVVDLMLDQKKVNDKGGTMRLGLFECTLAGGSRTKSAYGKEIIHERHRHRFELNNGLRDVLVKNGMKMTGLNTERDLVEIIELDDHPWFVGVQFHPELKSTVKDPHPLFVHFVKAGLNYATDHELVRPLAGAVEA
ncbi:MAG: CTP synthase, partial [Balneolales bacterium]